MSTNEQKLSDALENRADWGPTTGFELRIIAAVKALEAEVENLRAERDKYGQLHAYTTAALDEVIRERNTALEELKEAQEENVRSLKVAAALSAKVHNLQSRALNKGSDNETK